MVSLASSLASNALSSAGRNSAGTGVALSQRSRSPVPLSNRRADFAATTPAAKAWGTGNDRCDEWIVNRGVDSDVLDNLSRVPQHDRLNIVLATIKKNPGNPDAWISGCLRNHENEKKARVRVQSADVHPRDRCSPAAQEMSPIRSAVHATVGMVGNTARGSEPADEAVSMKEHWPRQKSHMINSILGVMEKEVLDKFLALDPEEQTEISFSFMVTAAKDNRAATRSVMLESWIDGEFVAYKILRQMPAHLSQPTSSDKINVQLVLAGMPAIMAGTIVAMCQHAIPRLHQVATEEINILPTIFVQVATEEIDIEAVGEAYRHTFRKNVQTMQDLWSELSQLLEEWKRIKTKFIFVTNVGLPSTPEEASHEFELSRLHRTDTEWIWPFHQVAHIVRQHTKDSDVAEIFFGPPAPAFIGQLSSLWGDLTNPSAAKHPRIPVVLPHVFSTPSGLNVLSVVDNEAYNEDPIEKWDAPEFAAWMEKYEDVPIPPSMACKLLVIKQFRERALKTLEEDMLKAITMKGDNGSRTGLSRARFMSLYGYLATPAEQLLDAALPCSGNVSATTGDPAPRASRYTAKCGHPRYCRKCEKLFSMLDRSYPTFVVGDVLLALITKVAPSWSGKSPVEYSMWERNSDVGRDDSCGPECRGHCERQILAKEKEVGRCPRRWKRGTLSHDGRGQSSQGHEISRE